MALYIVVHHQQDPRQTGANSWLDDDRLCSIQTTKHVATLCSAALSRIETVFIHRAGFGEIEPRICCSLNVQSVDTVDSNTSLVKFKSQTVCDEAPPIQPARGQNSYQYP